jgi:alpha-mannosidase
MNHFADMSGAEDVGVTLSNHDCYYMKLGTSSTSTLDTTTPQINVLAGGRGLGSSYGLPDQGGDSEFLQRFAMRTHGVYDTSSAMRFALEHQNPLVTGMISGESAALPASLFSAVTVDNPNVLLWALKPAEDGVEAGIILRLWNVGDGPEQAIIRLPGFDVTGATETTHIETDAAPYPVSQSSLSVDFTAQELRTFRVTGQSPSADIPTIATWGLAILTLLLITAATVVLQRRRRTVEAGRRL